jgi:glycosyltransferase involved in cell wall biosynthesis
MSDAKPPLLMPPEKDDIEVIRASRLFDAEWYQKTYPDVKALGMDPAEHYLWFGVRLERRPSKDFDPARYLRLNKEVAAAGLNPLLHYERSLEKANQAPKAGIVEAGLANHSNGIEAIRVVKTTPAPAIIVPIYNAPDCVEDCIRSVLHHTNQAFRLILIDDASPDPRVQDLLLRFAALPNVTVASNASNLGYTATVNRGISLAGEADVVLLNSDTVVTPLWLRNLQLAAYSGDRVATATPFSDNAGAFSAPRIGEPNAIPEQTGLDAYARLVTRNAARLYPEVPTGNGFCMYVRRACIDDIGAFDAEAFPRGYGEENDFCLRAAAAGWTHVVDDATLIHHVRSASFGPESDTLRHAGRAAVDQRYPEYPKAVEAMLADPLLDRARRNVDEARKKAVSGACVSPRILFVISTTSGGTPRTNEDLMKALDDRAEAFVLQCDSRVIQLLEVSGGEHVEVARHVLRTPTRAFPHRSEEYDAVLRTWLVRYAFETVHIRHIAWHSLGLVDEARLLGLPVIFSFHDYYTVCPTVKLLDDRMTYCGGRCTPGAGRCLMELWDTDEYPGLKHGAVHDWRKQFFDALTRCSAFVTTSAAARTGIIDAFPGLQDRRFEIIPHGRDFSQFDQPEPSWRDHELLRLLVPGHIVPAKGREIVAELGRRAAQLKLELHILGTIDPAIEATENVVLHGSYGRDEFRDRVRQIKPHVAGIFSIWPETFCHTLTELWACGIPVVAFDTGAVADRIRVHGGGWLCDVGDLKGLSHRLVDIRKDRAEYRGKLQDVRRWQFAEGRVHTTGWMAERYWEIYTQLAPGLRKAPEAPALLIEAAMKRLDGAQAGAGAPDDTIAARPDARQMPSVTHWRAYAQAVLSPATRGSVFERRLLAILQADTPIGISEALMASEAALERTSARMAKKRQRPLVSIVMPTHNRADEIDEAIRSVIEQDYGNWQLLVCDDASTDDTEDVVARFHDDRIHYLKLPRGGAAAARNAGLARAKGDIIAYLDSDNCWHPRYLSRMALVLLDRPGRSAAYGNYIDYKVDETSGTSVKSFVRPAFNQERLLRKNYIDLNTFVHRRELYDVFGGFNEALTRRQDYDLIIKYTWLRDPFRTGELLALYQRNPALRQITIEAARDDSCVQIIDDSISRYLAEGLPTTGARQVKRVTILSWDLCRNHFSKPFALAEALSESHDVQLVSFRFFDEEIFPPLKDVTPRFETVYLPGPRFPDFFEAMDKAIEAIDGDVIYVVKPRLPSLGTALLANARRGTPIILEINDLETVVASPTAKDRHRETAFDSVDLADPELLVPYSDSWSHIMDPIAKTLPVLATHNRFIDAHFGHRCLYMRNLKDEAVYDPALYDREAVRAELGFAPDDRIILFGGMVRRHKGIYELIDLVERLGDARYKLLFVGSRVTPDQTQLIEKFGTRVRVLPPQDRVAMARINLAADLVILWLDPDVPASHAQMPYKATDALAMKTPIIANDISDLGDLGRQGYLRLVPFGDWDAMARTIDKLFADQAATAAMREAGRRLYLRQFSYAAARADFALMLHRLQALDAAPLPAATAFARRFDEFRRTVTGAGADVEAIPLPPKRPAPRQRPAPPARLKIDGHGEAPEDASIVALDVTALGRLSHVDPEGVAIVMPSIDTATALATARLLVRRAGLDTTVFIVEDTLRQGFIRTLNATAARLEVRYVVYLAEDAFPGADWLKLAHARLEDSGKGLLAFNCGKWHGRIAAFGMVRTAWVETLYGGPVLYPAYRSHRADNEVTVIARATDQFVYAPDCVLTEIDARKAFRTSEAEAGNFTEDDKRLFIHRFDTGFDGLAPQPELEALRDEYLNQRKLALAGQTRRLDRGTAVSDDNHRQGAATTDES